MIQQDAIDWPSIAESLDSEGYAVTKPLLSRAACRRFINCYDDSGVSYRSVINMARYNFGQGEYKYFAYPLPRSVAKLRQWFYPPLSRIANTWAESLGDKAIWPEELEALITRCHEHGQTRPTPLLLRYEKDDYNCLHQDLYGPIHFPLQVVILLSDPEKDFQGGDLVLVEQRPRMQSRPMVVRPEQGSAVIFPVRERPRRGVRGFHRVQIRHGVARITSGTRLTMGLIFHDAT